MDDKHDGSGDEEYIESNVEIDLQSFIEMLSGRGVVSSAPLSEQILKSLQQIDWILNLTEDEVGQYRGIYEKICNVIATVPNIGDVLRLHIPDEEKADIIEKIIILNNTQPNTPEFLQLKRHLNSTIELSRKITLSQEEYDRYRTIEAGLTFDSHVDKPIKYQIFDLDVEKKVKSYIYQRYQYFNTLDASHSEYNKLRQWLDCALRLPDALHPSRITAESSPDEINKYLWDVLQLLNAEVFGLDSVKERIISLLNNRITNQRAKNMSFALCGPPGTAKTSIVRALAQAVDLPFYQINLGGAKDSSFFHGHGYTYEGAMPGAIAQALIAMKAKNGIIYFDEFDKISQTPNGADISNALLHITDMSQNDRFHDRYLSNNIDIDLSNIWFIYSLNDRSMVDKTLIDRITIIPVEGYTIDERIQIAEMHLIPKALANICISAGDVQFSQDSIRYLIEIADGHDVASKRGVRNLKHIIERLLTKLNLLRTVSRCAPADSTAIRLSFIVPGFSLPIAITRDVIDALKMRDDDSDHNSYWRMYA